ncbi:MAG: Zn-dependent hydrolase [Spirochaetae bacterium HGW-Spirochaetae-1]|nr:MAG: Zn-dependent hydrolase [Spirochaetae bacterium HGW-Spirochaetae-1]
MKKKSFTIHTIHGYISTIFLAEYPDKILLLDGGTISDTQRIKKFCETKLHRPVTEIRLCVATHIHPDHAGGAIEMRKLFGIPIAAHPLIDQWYRGISGFIQHKIDCALAHYVRAADRISFQRILSSRHVGAFHILQDGDRLPGFDDWQVFHVPGHTLHDLVLYNRSARLLYAGDCLINKNGKINLPIPVFFHGTMRHSYEKLVSLDIETILPAHGDAITGGNIPEIFNRLIEMLGEPKNDMSRMAHSVSIFAPPVWKAYIRKLKQGKES